MIFSDRKEIKLFLTFFILYSYFILWSGSAENSRFALTKALVDDGTIIIDKYYNQTTDRAYHNGHYYSDKAPGGSFLAVPVYASWKFIYNFFPENFKQEYSGLPDYEIVKRINEEDIIAIVNPGFFTFTSMILVTIFASSLFSSLTMLLVYKTSRYFTKEVKYRILLAVIFGAGTLIFHYAIVFLGHSIEMFFAFLSFYLLFKMKNEKKYDLKYFLTSGISAGYAITSGYPSILIAMGCLIYSLSLKWKKAHIFVIGLIIGLLPLLVYNFSIFGNPFDLTSAHADPKILPPESREVLLGGVGLSFIPNPMVILQLTVLPYRGMFFYYPILFFSLLGLYYMYKQYRLEAILVTIFLIGFIFVFSSFVDWWHGGYFGFRHILPVYPFLMLPLACCFKIKDRRIWFLLLLFMGISIFHNFIGLTGPYSDVLRVKGVLESKFLDNVKKGTIFENPLYYNYLPLFLRDGPRSKIFENLVNGYIDIDIRASPLSRGRYFPLIYGFHIPFLCLLPLVVFFVLIWKNEIYNTLKRFSKKQKIIFLSIIILIIFFFEKTLVYEDDIYLGKGWYPKAPNEVKRWQYRNGTIIVNNKDFSDKILKFSLVLSSYYKDRDASIYFNNEIIDNFNVSSKHIFEYSWILNLRPGKNTIRIDSATCDYPYKVEEGKDDERCLSIYMERFSLDEITDNFILKRNWFNIAGDDDVNWMYNNGIIQILDPKNNLKKVNADFILRSFYVNRDVDIYLNDQLIKTIEIPTNDTRISLQLEIKPGDNYLLFVSKENCTIMGKILGNDDVRCVTVGIKDFKLK